MKRSVILVLASAAGTLLALTAASAEAQEVAVPMHAISAEGVGEEIGTVTVYDSDNGLVLRVELDDIPAGPHGFHVHQNGSCEPGESNGQLAAGVAAGGHYDPGNSGKHLGPSGEGHKGDLPVLFVEDDESDDFEQLVVAPLLTLAEVRGKALMIHAGGDNYRDEPKPLGGGGGRMACGVVP